MPPLKTVALPVFAIAACLAGAGSAWAGHSHVSIGIGFGVPVHGHYGHRHFWPNHYASHYYAGPRHYAPRYYGPSYYGSSYYAYPTAPVYAMPVVVSQPVIRQVEPQVYIEQPRQSGGIEPQENSPYWYYCAERKAYYPYVKSCAGGWQQVSPTPQDR
jgi:hypothetical protein